MDRSNVRISAVRSLAAIAGAALVLGLAGGPLRAGEWGRYREANGPFSAPGQGFWSGDFGGGAEPTGGFMCSGALGPDAEEFARAVGFALTEIYPDLWVAEPTAETRPFDAFYFCQVVNGDDPSCGAEPDFFVRPPEGSQSNGVVLGSWFGRAQFERQQALSTIRTTVAHRHATGTGVVVAVLDTGIDAAHSAFDGRVLPGHDFVDLDEDASEGPADGLDEDGDGEADDGFGHGTTVAGLVLAAAPGARILPVRVLDEEARGTASSLAAGIRYAVDQGADVINLSLGAIGFSIVVQREIDLAFASGVIVVAAAGNTRGAPQAEFPANALGVIAATGSLGVPGDIWAPAVGVAGPYPGERWFRGRGTSFSAPLVSGGAALARQVDPAIGPWGIRDLLPPYRRHTYRLDLARLVR